MGVVLGKAADSRHAVQFAGLLKPVAYVVLKDGQASPDLAHELQEYVKRHTAPHKYPRAIVFVDVLPKTATGKIKRYQLRERAVEQNPLAAAPQSPH